MTRLKDIPVVTAPPRSGQKYVTSQGTTAIKDGIKARAASAPLPAGRKPPWLRAPMPGGEGFDEVRRSPTSTQMYYYLCIKWQPELLQVLCGCNGLRS